MRSPTPSLQARTELRKLGDDISIARRYRRMTQVRLAEGAGIDVSTLRKLEHGHPSVSLGTLAMVLLVLGETGRLGQLMDISKDDVGLVLGIHGLPKRVRTAREQPLAGATDKTTNADDDGVF